MMIDVKPGDASQERSGRNASVKANEIERAAYIAAHRILMADLSAADLACPGARRSRAVDAIAGLIKEVFELSTYDWDYCFEPSATSADTMERPRTTVVLELSRRASS